MAESFEDGGEDVKVLTWGCRFTLSSGGEGVTFKANGYVDMQRYLWVPEVSE